MSHKNRRNDAARRSRNAGSAAIDSLERRVLMSATPSSLLTKPIRQTLLNGMTLSASLKNTLQNDLNTNALSAFDTAVLNYMQTRTNAHWFFDVASAGSIATY